MLSTQRRRHLNSSQMGFAGLLIGFTLQVCVFYLELFCVNVPRNVFLQSEMLKRSPTTEWLWFLGCLMAVVEWLAQLLSQLTISCLLVGLLLSCQVPQLTSTEEGWGPWLAVEGRFAHYWGSYFGRGSKQGEGALPELFDSFYRVLIYPRN